MLVLPAQLTHSQAAACVRMLTDALRRAPSGEAAPACVVDASALARFDSSALAVLLECRREALAFGKAFAVRHLPSQLRDLAVLYGVDALLPAAN